MLTHCTQHPAQVEEFRPIQVQSYYGCSLYYSKSYDDYEVLAPGKVPHPTLTTRMKEWHRVSCLWIWRMSLRVLACVTPRARPGKVLQCRLATGFAGADVFAVKGCSGKESGTAADSHSPRARARTWRRRAAGMYSLGIGFAMQAEFRHNTP
jgi:hypothetical protein